MLAKYQYKKMGWGGGWGGGGGGGGGGVALKIPMSLSREMYYFERPSSIDAD